MATQLITLEGDSEYYTVGVPIKGTVNIMMPKAKTVTGVYVRLNGNVYTHWVKEGIKCYYNENFIDQSVCVFTPQEKKMEAGTYNFPFMFTIPTNVIIPPAGDYEFGAITYKIVSEVCRPGPEPYIRSEIVLPLISNIYVDVQNYAQPSSGTIERGLCCCCCATDFFKLSVSVPRTGWYPGEVIPIRVEGENKSGKVIKDYTVAIVAEITLYSGPSKASIKKIINNVAHTKIEEPIQPHSTFSKSHELKMPNIGPSFGLDACCAIQRRFYVACSAFYNIVCVCTPIVVGLDPADATPMALGMPAGDKSVVPTTQPDYLEKLKVCAELENAAAAAAAANNDDADVADKK